MPSIERFRLNWQTSIGLGVSIYAFFSGFWNPGLATPVLLAYAIWVGISHLVIKNPRYLLRYQWSDLFFLAVLLTEIISQCTSIYPANSFYQLESLLYAILLYLCLRLTFTNRPSTAIVLSGIGIFAFIMATVALLLFMILQTQVRIQGFEDLSQLKQMFSPFGLLTNEWATICIGFLPFPILAIVIFQRIKWISYLSVLALALISASLLSTFSRGGYLAWTAFCILTPLMLLLFRAVQFKTILKIALPSLLLVVLFMSQQARPVITTFSFNRTVSQQRSIQGRMNILEESVCQWQDHKWFGTGAFNYPIINDRCKKIRDDDSYSVFTNNTYLEIILEKGWVGFLMYTAFLVSILLTYIDNIRKMDSPASRQLFVIALAGLLALLLREFFFSTLFHSSGALTLLIIFISLASFGKASSKGSGGWQAILMVPIVIGGFFVMYKSDKLELAKEYAKQGIRQNRASMLDKAIECQPSNACFHAEKALAHMRIKGLDSLYLEWRGQHEPKQIYEIIKIQEAVVAINPFDGGHHFNLACLQAFVHHHSEAKEHLEKSLMLEPNVAEYLVGGGLIRLLQADSSGARELFRRAFRIHPDLFDAPVHEFIKIKLPAFADSLPFHLEKNMIQQIDASYNTIIAARLARIHLETGKVKEAEELFLRVIDELPDLNRPYFHLSRIYSTRSQPEKQKTMLDKSLFLDRDDHLVLAALGDYHYQAEPASRAEIYSVLHTYRSALLHWLRKGSFHHLKSGDIYQNYVGSHNDLFLQDLLYACRPSIDIPTITSHMADMYLFLEDEELADHYRALSNIHPSALRMEDLRK